MKQRLVPFRASFVIVILLTSLLCPCESVGPPPNGLWCYWEDVLCDPNSWDGLCATGRNQSPIDLDVKTVNRTGHIFTHNAIHRMNFFYGNELLRYTSFGLQNNGHTAQFTLPANANPPVFVEPFLPDKGKRYTFSQGHFHWGLSAKNGINGSEHAINGKFYGAELHLVHYAEQYGSFANAMANAPFDHEAILVLAILLDITVGPNLYLEPIIKYVPEIYAFDPALPVRTFPGFIQLDKIFPPNLDFFRYHGSLTSPPCTEQVLFFVFKTPIPISNKQLEVFRRIADDVGGFQVRENFRHLQPRFDHILDLYKVHQTYNLLRGLPTALSYVIGSIVTLFSEVFNFSSSFPLRILGVTNETQSQSAQANFQHLLGNYLPPLSLHNLYSMVTQFGQLRT